MSQLTSMVDVSTVIRMGHLPDKSLELYHTTILLCEKRTRNRRMLRRDEGVFKSADVSYDRNGLWKTFESRMQSRNHTVQEIEGDAYTEADHSP